MVGSPDSTRAPAGPVSRFHSEDSAMLPTLSVPKEKLKFVLFEGIHASAVEALRRDGYSQIVACPRP